MLPTQSGNGKGVSSMAIIISLLITIVGGVVCHFIIKWLDSDDKGNK